MIAIARSLLLTLLVGLAPAGAQVAPPADGEVDPAFGFRAVPAGMTLAKLTGLAVGPDGSVLLVWIGGTSEPGCDRGSTGLARLRVDGEPDGDFGDVVTPGRTRLLGLCSERLSMMAVALQPDGRILLAGTRRTASGTRAVVIRLLPNGAIDTSFGVAGLATLDRLALLAPDDDVTDVTYVDGPDSRIVVTGSVRDLAVSPRADGLLFTLDGAGNGLAEGQYQDPDGVRYRREPVTRPGWRCDTVVQRGVRVDAAEYLTAVAAVACLELEGLAIHTYSYPMLLRMPLAGAGPSLRVPFSFDPNVDVDPDQITTTGELAVYSLAGAAGPDGRFWVRGRQIRLGTGGNAIAAFDPGFTFASGTLGGPGRIVLPAAEPSGDAFAVTRGGRLLVGGEVADSALYAAVDGLLASTGQPDPSFAPSTGSTVRFTPWVGMPREPRIATDAQRSGLILAFTIDGRSANVGDSLAVTRLFGVDREGAAPVDFADGFE